MPTLISIVGPTGVGKSAVALRLAQEWACPIVSADSVQVYRGLDIGSGKVTAEEQALVPHHLLDIVPPDADFSAGEWVRRCDAVLAELFRQHAVVIAVGGTGFYFQGLWEGFDEMPEVDAEVRERLNARLATEGLARLQADLAAADPETWATIDRQNPARVLRALEVYEASGMPISAFRRGRKRQNPWTDVKVGLELPREELYGRIDQRVEAMLSAGWLAEAQSIAEKYGWDCKGLASLGYRELGDYVRGELDWSATVALIQRNTRRYAKRQLTWFGRYEDIRWFHPLAGPAIADYVRQLVMGAQ